MIQRIMEKKSSSGILDFLKVIAKPSVGLVAILALTFYLRLLYFGQMIDSDVGNLGYMAWRMTEGEVLIDLEGPGKPPLYPMLYALFIRLFGDSVLGIKMFGAIFVLLAVLAVYWLANQAYGKKVGLLSAFLFGVFSSGPMVEGGTVNLETVLHFPYILAVGLFLKASISRRPLWYFFAGLLATLATLVKQVGGVLFIVFLCYGIHDLWKVKTPSRRKECLSRYLLLGGGALLPVIGLIIFYSFHGYTLYQLYDSIIGSNLRYMQRGHESIRLLDLFALRFKYIFPENGLLWIGTGFAMVYLIWQIMKDKGQSKDRILLWWAFWSFLVLWGSGFFFPHYFLQIISPFSILTAYGMTTIWGSVKSLRSLPRLIMQGGWMVLLIILIMVFIKTDYKYFFSYTPVEQTMFQHPLPNDASRIYGLFNIVQYEIARHIRDHTDSTETIYVWGISPQIYFLAKRRAATRYRNNFDISVLSTNNLQGALQAYAPTVMEDIKKSSPAYIVKIFHLEDFPELQTFIKDHYIREEDLEFFTPPYQISLYRRCRDRGVLPNTK
jgi:4-amino-4-deoxy-L-arabinose transferase-like glycosyltransferase